MLMYKLQLDYIFFSRSWENCLKTFWTRRKSN